MKFTEEADGHVAECQACRDWIIWHASEKHTRDAAAAHQLKCKKRETK